MWLTRINYMKNARYWVFFSLILTIVSAVALVSVGLNKGIDFTGGDMLDLQFEQAVTQGQVSDAVGASLGTGSVSVQGTEVKTGGATTGAAEFLVKTPEMTPEQRTKLLADMEGKLGKFTIIGEENVSGSVSQELTRNAIIAIAVAVALQLIYVWIRFEFKLGVTAVLALVHDVIITMGLMAIFRVEINAAFVAAILTVLGYSMNDTVVVIDRIRENLAKRKKGEPLETLTTRSIQEVITRSLFTGVSVQMMLIALMVLGGDSIKDFAVTLLIGITAGTYSSIFIASALWLFWHQWEDKRKPAPGAKTVKV